MDACQHSRLHCRRQTLSVDTGFLLFVERFFFFFVLLNAGMVHGFVTLSCYFPFQTLFPGLFLCFVLFSFSCTFLFCFSLMLLITSSFKFHSDIPLVPCNLFSVSEIILSFTLISSRKPSNWHYIFPDVFVDFSISFYISDLSL